MNARTPKWIANRATDRSFAEHDRDHDPAKPPVAARTSNELRRGYMVADTMLKDVD